jgi:hypothetical protein
MGTFYSVETNNDPTRYKVRDTKRLQSIYWDEDLSSSHQTHEKYSYIDDKYETYQQLETGLRKAGLEASQLIVAIDFTKSNTWQGGLPYYQSNCLHSMYPYPNPYQQVLNIMCRSLRPFDDDGFIPAYGFGDATTKDKAVFSLLSDNVGQDCPCLGLEGVLESYNRLLSSGRLQMSGPTSFAPAINKAIELVQRTREYHILLIICDGAVTETRTTIEAIRKASNYALSIVCIGVGKGPWVTMEHFDDSISGRNFDNFQFVNFHAKLSECHDQEVEFAKHALMEIPTQYKYIKKYIL